MLLVIKTISMIRRLDFDLIGKRITLSEDNMMQLFLGVYFVINLALLVPNFNQGYGGYDNSHTVLMHSKEISEYVPNGEIVYGLYALGLSLENEIIAFNSNEGTAFLDRLYDIRLEQLRNGTIDYAILGGEINEGYYEKKEPLDEIDLRYIEQNFEIIKIMHGKKGVSDSLSKDMYIYKRLSEADN